MSEFASLLYGNQDVNIDKKNRKKEYVSSIDSKALIVKALLQSIQGSK